MKNLFNSQTGSSLVQVMVISGMVSVFGLAVMQTSKNMQGIKQTMIAKDSVEQFRHSVANLLANKEACNSTLGAAIASRAQIKSDKNISLIKDSAGLEAYRLFNTSTPAAGIYHGSIRIESMKLTSYDQAKDLAVLEVVVLTSSRNSNSPISSANAFGTGILGGGKQILQIPIRAYFDTDPNEVAKKDSDPFRECYSEGVDINDTNISPLEVLCDRDLGGSYYNGKCIVADYIIESARQWDEPCAAGECDFKKVCSNMGGTHDSSNQICKPRFADAECPPGLVLKGFDTEGNIQCGTP